MQLLVYKTHFRAIQCTGYHMVSSRVRQKETKGYPTKVNNC